MGAEREDVLNAGMVEKHFIPGYDKFEVLNSKLCLPHLAGKARNAKQQNWVSITTRFTLCLRKHNKQPGTVCYCSLYMGGKIKPVMNQGMGN